MKVLLVVIDAATPRVVCPAIQTGRLPVMQRLAAAGSVHPASTAIFPSITPAATSSIITGAYPAGHGIVGAAWFDEARNEVAYYGDDFWVVAREGFGTFLRDFLVRLNGDRLKAPTLFEVVERAGASAASLNYLVFRGDVRHRVNVPWLMALLPGVPLTEEVMGPSILCLGDFVRAGAGGGKVRHEGGLLHRFGMDDASTAAMLCQLAGEGPMPDFTVAYFADTDYRSHEVGPHAGLPTVERVDEALGRMLDAAGGMERFLRHTAVLITSDHGHCEVLEDGKRSVIRLDEVLGAFRQARLGRPWDEADEILICPNMRAAQVYLREPAEAAIRLLADAALADGRIDQVMWRTGPQAGERPEFVVASDRGEVRFARGGRAPNARIDDFGTAWRWDGAAGALDLDTDEDRVVFGQYPNAFERIAGALEAPGGGEVWMTAKPGCEFAVEGGLPHPGGGSHGALHALDSLTPVVAAGLPDRLRLPAAMRTVDIAPLCLELLGLPGPHRVGDPRV